MDARHLEIGRLLEELRSADESACTNAAFELVKFKEEEHAVYGLLEALSDPKPLTRNYAVFALAEIGDPVSVEPILAMLGDADLGVRIRAAWALSRIGDRNSLPRLAAALGDSMNGDAHLARQLIVALADIGGREATDDIAVALQSSIPEARGVAAHFLDYVGGERARQLLAEHLLQETDADVRAAIEEALQT